MTSSRHNRVELDLYDIINGYSTLKNAQGREFFFKHISNFGALKADRIYEDALSSAIRKGIAPADKILEEAILYGAWSIEDDELIKAKEWELSNLERMHKKTTNALQKQHIATNIENKQKEIEEKAKKKRELCALSAENLAEKKRLEYLVTSNCFVNKKCSKKYVLQTDDSQVLQEFLLRFNNKNHLIKCAYCPSFFELFMIYRKIPHYIFSRQQTAFEMTCYQKNLIVYAGILLNKLEYGGENLTDQIRENPIALFNFDPEAKKQTTTTDGIEDLREAQKRKGKITPEDLLS